MTSTLSTAAAGSNCPAGGTDPRCSTTVTVLVPALSIVQAANTTAAVPGQTVTYTLTVTDTGQTPYAGATVTDTLNLLDDATYNNDAAATSGTVSYASPVITWTGDLAVGASAVITWTVTVNNPDTGDKNLATVAASTDPGSSCPPGSSSAGCTLTIPVLTPAPDHRQDRGHDQRQQRGGHPRRGGDLHDHRDQHRADPLHRGEPDRPAGRRCWTTPPTTTTRPR